MANKSAESELIKTVNLREQILWIKIWVCNMEFQESESKAIPSKKKVGQIEFQEIGSLKQKVDFSPHWVSVVLKNIYKD